MITLVTAFWPATGSKFMQAFESEEAALAKYRDLKADSGAVVSIEGTIFKSVEEIGLYLMAYDQDSQGPRH